MVLGFIKSKLKKEPSPEDIILALLVNMYADRFPRDSVRMHMAVLQLKNQPRYADLLKDFDFETEGTVAYSKRLEKVITAFESNGTLAWNQFDVYIFDPADKKKKAEDINARLGEKYDVLLEMSRKFEDIVTSS